MSKNEAVASTPLERAAEAVNVELVRQVRDGWVRMYTTVGLALERRLVRAVFESIDLEGLVEAVQRNGVVTLNVGEAHAVATAIKAYLLGEKEES